MKLRLPDGTELNVNEGVTPLEIALRAFLRV